VGWLAAVRSGLLDDDDLEPPVPPGLAHASPALRSLARFLRIDDDLLAAAARSPEAAPEPGRDKLAAWVAGLPAAEKDARLVRLLSGEAAPVRADVLRRFRAAHATPRSERAGGRTVGELHADAEARRAERRRREAERRATERARREAERAAARKAHLRGLVGREDALWREVDAQVQTRLPKGYDRAVELLVDLRDLAARADAEPQFRAGVAALRERYASRPSLRQRLDRAGLTG
jgi:hypothetical protein